MKRLHFDRDAAPYVAEQLGDGGTLARRLLSSSGPIDSVWAHVASNTDRLSLMDFRDTELREEREACDLALVTLIKDHLDGDQFSCVVFEHALAHPSDPFLAKSDVPRFAIGLEVYFFLMGPGQPTQRVQHLVDTAQTYRLVGCLTRGSSELTTRTAGGVTPEAVDQLVSATTRVIMLAWHMTGYLIWDVTRSALGDSSRVGGQN